MDYLEQFSTVNQVVIPIKTDDHLIMVKIDDIILAEIDKNQLTIYTTDKTFTVRDTLTNFQHRINRRNFLQISRHAVMNIDHLESLSDSFSGNMMAKLDTWSKIKCQSEICQILDGLFRGIGESDETSYSLFCIWYEDRILLLFVFVLLSHVYPNIVYPAVNVRNILAIFLMSGTMGVLTFILEEEEFLTYSLRVALHLVVTATILALTYLFFFGWGQPYGVRFLG